MVIKTLRIYLAAKLKKVPNACDALSSSLEVSMSLIIEYSGVGH